MGNASSVAMAESSEVVEEETESPVEEHPEAEEGKQEDQTQEEAQPEEPAEETTEEESTEATEAEESSVVRKITVDDIKTAPPDWRFPTTNQAKHCFTRYNEYHKCIKDKGEGAPECDKYKRYYYSLCPLEWIERWDEQRANGTFPGRY